MKKIICLLFEVLAIVSVLGITAAAYSDANIDKAIAAALESKKTVVGYNDMTMDEFLALVRKQIPEDLGVYVDYSLTGNFFYCTNSTATKDGKVSAKFRFCHVEKQFHPGQYEYESEEYVTYKIPAGSPSGKAEASDKTGFTDVPEDAYYAASVKWAVEKGITTGTTPTTFSPDTTCTRAQIITFLYRAAGSPVQLSASPFSDVKQGDYFYDASTWASKKGMVKGATFDGNTPCTRAETVTYLWIYSNKFNLKKTHQFTDVPDDASYAKAVAWAYAQGITTGTTPTTFSPEATCTRGQIVTFLDRTVKKIKKV